MIYQPADAPNIFADVIADLPPPPWPGDPKVGLWVLVWKTNFDLNDCCQEKISAI